MKKPKYIQCASMACTKSEQAGPEGYPPGWHPIKIGGMKYHYCPECWERREAKKRLAKDEPGQ